MNSIKRSRMLPIFICSSVLGCLSVEAQAVAGTEPRPAGIQVAPGEITTFQIPGLALRIEQPIFARDPLPFEVAGISLRLKSLETGDVFESPIFNIRQVDDCPDISPRPNCRTTLVTVHIPVDLKPLGYYSRTPSYPPRGSAPFRLEVLEGGVIQHSIPVFAVRSNIRILTTCDYLFEVNELGEACTPIVRHPDGTLAHILGRGQAFSVYVTGIGLGNVDGILKTGTASPEDPSLDARIKVYGVSGTNVPPVVPYGRNSVSMPIPGPFASAKLVVGAIGVFRIGLSAPGDLADSLLASCFNNLTSAFSNFAFSLVSGAGSMNELGSASFAGLPVCVKESPVSFENAHSAANERAKRSVMQ